MINTLINFAILDIKQIVTWTGYLIRIITNNPCHLYMNYTTTEPEKHKTAVISRGLPTLENTRYCFVTWEANEQIEEGDTLIHTFYKPDWPICETRYFTFKGTINGETSPSVGPIFTKHRKTSEWGLLFTEPWTWLGVPPPDMPTNIITEPWTWLGIPPPDMPTNIITEPWNS